ncbi:hypothetical protein E2562_018248 [Oryza meyeriana var. granulata]|uniref:Uncharacterized protein n=1 Tax=Oryza meyeriana var. granulata TaxID=110450 RepID=A0A6G1CGQ2_9ORYZ|nr:hypothetical protein E2562_018248 [Oryza meyeriana var. granulata]
MHRSLFPAGHADSRREKEYVVIIYRRLVVEGAAKEGNVGLMVEEVDWLDEDVGPCGKNAGKRAGFCVLALDWLLFLPMLLMLDYICRRVQTEDRQMAEMCLELYKEHGTKAGLNALGYELDNDVFHTNVHDGFRPKSPILYEPSIEAMEASIRIANVDPEKTSWPARRSQLTRAMRVAWHVANVVTGDVAMVRGWRDGGGLAPGGDRRVMW